MNDHPWYMRTEFWSMIVTFGMNIGVAMGLLTPEDAKSIMDATANPEAAGTYVAAQGQMWLLIIINLPVIAYIIGRSIAKVGGTNNAK